MIVRIYGTYLLSLWTRIYEFFENQSLFRVRWEKPWHALYVLLYSFCWSMWVKIKWYHTTRKENKSRIVSTICWHIVCPANLPIHHLTVSSIYFSKSYATNNIKTNKYKHGFHWVNTICIWLERYFDKLTYTLPKWTKIFEKRKLW